MAAAADAGRAFVADVFEGTPPRPVVVWLDDERRDAVAGILGHAPGFARARVWLQDGRAALVLDEVAHTQPITAGFVVAGSRIVEARVLVYRESRGGAIRSPAWLGQLTGRSLAEGRQLDARIDGLTGATLSVAAMTRMARLALYLAAEAAGAAG